MYVMARTSSIYDHFDLYLTPVTLTFNLPKNVSNGTFPPRGQQLCIIILKSVHKCTSYGPDKLNNDHFDLYLTPLTLTFNLPEKMFQMALFLLEGNDCAKLFRNPCIYVQIMARTSSIHVYDHFDFYLIPVTLTLNLPKNVSNDTSPPQGQLYQIVLKSMHYCTSYGPYNSGRTHALTPNKNCNNYVSLTAGEFTKIAVEIGTPFTSAFDNLYTLKEIIKLTNT